jgi:hypothetical protein
MFQHLYGYIVGICLISPAWVGENCVCYADRTLSQVFVLLNPLKPEVPTSQKTRLAYITKISQLMLFGREMCALNVSHIRASTKYLHMYGETCTPVKYA